MRRLVFLLSVPVALGAMLALAAMPLVAVGAGVDPGVGTRNLSASIDGRELEDGGLRIAPALIRMRIISPAFSTWDLRANKRLVDVTGSLACDPGEMFRVDVQIVQWSTGAHGVGHTQGFCTGDVQQWHAIVAARGPASFMPGAADVIAVALTRAGGEITDTHVWERSVNLS
jgi:hypothetical protein